MPEDTTRSCAEPNQQRRQTTKCNPVSIAVLGCSSPDVIAHMVASNAEEGHGDNPGYKGADSCKRGEQGHENSACTVVASPTQAEED